MTIFFSFLIFDKIFQKKDKKVLENNIVKESNEKNLIEGIKYSSKDLDGNTYLIEAENGILDQDNQDIIHLKNVSAKINFDNNKLITISSSGAVYNINNYDTT